MAGVQRNWIRLVVLPVLLVGAGAAAGAQVAGLAGSVGEPNERTRPKGSIAGRLTDLRSKPLAGVTVVVRDEATGVEARTTTSKNGGYRLGGLEAGEYTLEAESPRLGRGQLQGIHVAGGGYEARIEAAMEFEPEPASEPATADAAKILALTMQHAAKLTLDKPATVSAVGLEPMSVETLWPMPLTGRTQPGIVPMMMATRSTELESILASEPLRTLDLTGRRLFLTNTVSAGQLTGHASGEGLAQSASLAANGAKAVLASLQSSIRSGVAATQQVDPVTPAVTTTLTAAELQAMPVAGRHWQDFVLDSPTAATQAGGVSQTSLRGAGSEPVLTSIDGASTRLAFGGSGSSGPESSGPGSNGEGGREQNGMGQAWAGGRGSPVAEAAIHEVQTAAGNAESEGARTAGGLVNVETARGTNGLHGQAFLLDRQNTWGARNPFTQWVKETGPPTQTATPVFTAEPYTPPDHETVWGFGMGSQIRRDKLFWFGAVDSYRRNDPGLATVKHPDEFFAQPSNDEMQVLSARLGLSGSNPVAEGLNAYSQTLTTLDGLLGPASRTAAQWVGFGRVDWDASERNRITLEGTGARWNSPGGGLTRVSETFGSNSFGSSEASEDLLLGRWEAFLTPNLLAVTQGSLGRTIQSANAETPSIYEQTFLSANAWGQLPQMVVDSRYGFTIGNPSRFGTGSYPDEQVYQVQETADWVRGGLLLKGGFALSHNADATSLLRNETGTYSYSSAENFASDALVFAQYGLGGELNPNDQHNCDETGKVWRDSIGNLRGLGSLPCYSYYSQVIGPADWNLSTNDWSGFTTAQWQPRKLLVVSGGLRWEREQLPPPIAALNNTELPLTEKLPSLGNNWGPRISLAVGNAENHWPVLRLGYGMYFGRTENATLETALTQTGSLNGDQNFFLRPTDNLNAGGAPPFPYVLRGAPSSVVKPGALEFAPNFRNPEVHQAVTAVEEELPGHVQVTASALVSLGRRLPISIDTNFDPMVNPGTITYAVVDGTGAGPIKTPQITIPFYASWPSSSSPAGFSGRLNPDYQQISQIMSRANSTYEAASFKVERYGRRGLSLHAHYTYAHAMDWNPNESATVAGNDVLDPAHFSQEYGTSDLDVRHSAAVMMIYDMPWKLSGPARWLASGWMVSTIGQYRSGLPYTMRTSGSLAEEFNQSTGGAIVGLGPGMNGSGGDNRVYGVGRNTFRYPATWKVDMRAGKKFDLGAMRELELLVESFNLFNHQNVTELETTGYSIESGSPSSPYPTLNFLTGLKANTTAFGQPLNINATDFYRERQIQVGVRMRF